jgi:hypothetical protein
MEEIGGGKTRMTIESEFPTVEAMEQLTGGVEEGLMQAVGQIDAILAEDGKSTARIASTETRPTDEIRASVRS